MPCVTLLDGNFDAVCGHKPKQGVLEKYYVNYDDIDRTGTTLANSNNLISSLVLKAGAKIYRADGNDKQFQGQVNGVVGDYGNGFSHVDILNLANRKINEREQVQKIADGARVVVIMKLVDGSDDDSTKFVVFGYEAGMKFNAYAWDTNANSGVASLTVASVEGEEEATPEKVFLDTNLTTTETWISTNTYVAP